MPGGAERTTATGAGDRPRRVVLLFAGRGGGEHLPWATVDVLGAAWEAAEAVGNSPPALVLWELDEALVAALAGALPAWEDWPVEVLAGATAIDRVRALAASPRVGLGPTDTPVAFVLFAAEKAGEAASLLAEAGPGAFRGGAAAPAAAAETRPTAGDPLVLLPPGIDLEAERIAWELVALQELTDRLRRDCPWDRKQTQEDIVAYTLEETYELIDAVRDSAGARHDLVCGELGDLLFQVYFLARVAQGEGWYDLGHVVDGIRRKLIRRHPHIFGQAVADTPDEVRRTWDEIKRTTEGREGIFHDVPAAFPAVLFAQKLQQRAAVVGFDWEQAREVLDKVREEVAELEEVLDHGHGLDRSADEVGDLLFTLVNLARKLKVDPELALRAASHRFQERVERAEALAEAEGHEFAALSLEEKEGYFQHAKAALAAE